MDVKAYTEQVDIGTTALIALGGVRWFGEHGEQRLLRVNQDWLDRIRDENPFFSGVPAYYAMTGTVMTLFPRPTIDGTLEIDFETTAAPAAPEPAPAPTTDAPVEPAPTGPIS